LKMTKMTPKHRTGIEPKTDSKPDRKRVFTKRLIENIEPPTTGRRYIYDAKVPGLRLQTTDKGVKTFQFYRWFQDRPLLITLGRFPAMTVEQARQQAKKHLGELAEGKDPGQEKKRRRDEAITLRQAMEDYIKSRDLKPATVEDTRTRMERYYGDWMNKKLLDISPDMVTKRYARLLETAPTAGSTATRYLRSILNFAIAAYDHLPLSNPVDRLSKARMWKRPQRRRTVIEANQLPAWWKALDSINPHHADIFRFVVLTGFRKKEALGLRWEDVNLETRVVTLTDTKARRPHALPLTDFLLDLLKRRQRFATSDFVFADDRGRVPGNFRYSMAKVEALSGVRFTLHDLRRTFTTVAESLDIPAYALKRLINHSDAGDVTASYIIMDVERLRKPMQKISDYVMKTVGEQEGATVTALTRKEVQ